MQQDLTVNTHAMRRWQYMAAGLGILGLIENAVVPSSSSSIAGILSTIFFAALAVLLFLAGRQAFKEELHPSWQAGLCAVIYGFFTGLGALIFPPRMGEVIALLHREEPKLSSAQLHQAALVAISTGARIESLISTVIFTGLFGLLLGWLGSRSVRRPRPDLDV